MPRIAIISDVHGNLAALLAILADIERAGIDRIVCLGDVVGYGPQPAECLELVLERCRVVVRGNHEDAILDDDVAHGLNPIARRSIAWTRERLDSTHRRAIERLPFMAEPIPGLLCVHDAPVPNPFNGYLKSARAAAPVLRRLDAGVCLHGHTHVPALFSAPAVGAVDHADVRTVLPGHADEVVLAGDARHLLNPGAVGQPRDADPRASWASLDLATRTARFHRVAYDVHAVRSVLATTDLPEQIGRRLAMGA